MGIDLTLLKEYFKYLNANFHNEYILVGSFIDYVEIQTDLSKDIDVIITKNKFESIFEKNQNQIQDNDLNISHIKYRSLFRTLTFPQYSGYYQHNIKTDIFILDMKRINCDHPIADLDKKSMYSSRLYTIEDTTVRLSQTDYRVCCLKYLLKVSYDSKNIPRWTQDWLQNKRPTIINKLNLYYQKYPEFKSI